MRKVSKQSGIELDKIVRYVVLWANRMGAAVYIGISR